MTKSGENFSIPKKSFVWPFLLIFCGITLFLNNLELVSWSVWAIIFKFWPILLILTGTEYAIGNNSLGRLVFTIITVLIFGFVFVFSISTTNPKIDRFLEKRYPFWDKIKKIVPRENLDWSEQLWDLRTPRGHRFYW